MSRFASPMRVAVDDSNGIRLTTPDHGFGRNDVRPRYASPIDHKTQDYNDRNRSRSQSPKRDSRKNIENNNKQRRQRPPPPPASYLSPKKEYTNNNTTNKKIIKPSSTVVVSTKSANALVALRNIKNKVSESMNRLTVNSDMIGNSTQFNNGHSVALQKQSLRWLNLSTTLWTLIIMDAERIADYNSTRDFVQVMNWRSHGKINSNEFTALYNEWIGKNLPLGKDKIDPNKKKNTIGLLSMRQILLDLNISESDLDLFVGMIIHETNVNFLNTPISYLMKQNGLKHSSLLKPSSNLEVCTKRWIDLCEELFFCLDTPGYGELRYDEMFFFAGCLTIGLQGWTNEAEIENDLSLGVLCATALQMMNDAGATINITSKRHEILDIQRGIGESEMKRDTLKSSTNKNNTIISPSYIHAYYNHNLFAVSLPMFKLFLMQKGINDSQLAALVVHVKSVIERMARLTYAHAEDLYSSSKPLENRNNIGSPRLWQQAVCIALGYDPLLYEKYLKVETGETLVQHPPALLILLSDCERLIPGVLRALETPLDMFHLNQNNSNNNGDIYNSINYKRKSVSGTGNVQRLSPFDEFHETAHRLWASFRVWGSPYTYRGIESEDNGIVSMASLGIDGIAEIQTDPIYQLIIHSLIIYKNLQLKLCAALYDLTIAHYFTGVDNDSGDPIASVSQLVCASVIPIAESMMVKLGIEDGVIGNTAPITEVKIQKPKQAQAPINAPALILHLQKGKTEELNSLTPLGPSVNKNVISNAQWSSLYDVRDTNSPSKNGVVESLNKHLSRPSVINMPVSDILVQSRAVDTIVSGGSTIAEPLTTSSSNENEGQKNEVELLHLLVSTTNPVERDNLIAKLREYHSSLVETSNISQQFESSSESKNDSVGAKTTYVDSSVGTDADDIRGSPVIDASVQTSKISSVPKSNTSTTQTIRNKSAITSVTQTPYGKVPSTPSTVPRSIAELLEQGQDAGKYAQTLREILRAMSYDDSKVQLKSLEKVLELGERIVLNEREYIDDKKNHNSPSPENKRYGIPKNNSSAVKVKSFEMPTESSNHRVAKVNSPRFNSSVDNSDSFVSSNMSAEKVITSRIKGRVPGVTPSSSNKVKKVFGHPL